MQNPLSFNRNAPKKPANLTINSELLQISREFHINLSQALEQKLVELLNEKIKHQWLEQNKEALEDYNRWVEKNGVFSDGMRKF